MWDIVDDEIKNLEFNDDNNTPKKYFKKKKTVKEKIINQKRWTKNIEIIAIIFLSFLFVYVVDACACKFTLNKTQITC